MNLPTAMKRTAIIFGASLAGRRTLEYYEGQYRVLAFADNDAKKHGTVVAGLPVIDPAGLPTTKCDCILIGSSYTGPITKQLVAMGVPSSRIGWVNGKVLNGDFEGVGRFRAGWIVTKWIAWLAAIPSLGWWITNLVIE